METRPETLQIPKNRIEPSITQMHLFTNILTDAMSDSGTRAKASSITPDLPRNSPLVGLKGLPERTECDLKFKCITISTTLQTRETTRIMSTRIIRIIANKSHLQHVIFRTDPSQGS